MFFWKWGGPTSGTFGPFVGLGVVSSGSLETLTVVVGTVTGITGVAGGAVVEGMTGGSVNSSGLGAGTSWE